MFDENLRGLTSRAHAVRTSASDNDLKRLVRAGTVERPWRGHYLTTGALTGHPENVHAEKLERYRAKVIAAARSSRGDRVVSHSSAAALHGIPLLSPDLDVVHFTTMKGTGRAAGRAIIHQAPIDPDDLVEKDGVPLTSVSRTIADVARAGTFPQALTALDQGLRRGAKLIDLERIAQSQSRWHGIEMLRRSIPLATPLAASVGESYSRAIIFEFEDIPDPDVQYAVGLRGGASKAWCDFGWEDKVVGEFDGHVKYTRNREFGPKAVEDVVYEEKLREDAIRDRGLWVIRWAWSDLHNPRELHRKLVEGLTRGGIL
ncbi:hypothetical protein GOEFS_019_00300 [Gordonia effusa NBRC 100432]|uniref:AbiEi antitoxin C-terminal domain-containing protein n=2 Tax=Gordonia effusa TaxID=263908 RepID=H0QWB6_9ACTN|nr:hypothetical protein GOEFS_019_00300 [Gordonia effusa NBRC 100432]